MCNDDARTEADLAETPKPTGRLRFVPAASASNGHGAHERLPVFSDADEELGTFDGLIVDTASEEPRYAIVDSGGLFIHRRYLMPFDDVGFDTEKRALRAHVGKDVANRYPSFDPDEFGKMSDGELRRYEARLLRLFPREACAAHTARNSHDPSGMDYDRHLDYRAAGTDRPVERRYAALRERIPAGRETFRPRADQRPAARASRCAVGSAFVPDGPMARDRSAATRRRHRRMGINFGRSESIQDWL